MHISPSTLSFLSDLKNNNNREWFQENRDLYEAAHQNVKDFVAALIVSLSKIDPYINDDIPVSKCLFRIYRDTRFSKDKTPYKNWFGAGISVAGRKLNGPEYYLHIAPETSFIAGGYWRPEKEHLAAIRQEIDYNGDVFKTVISAKEFQKYCTLDFDDKLKKAPSGYDPDHPEIEFLKLKSFTASHRVKDNHLTSKNALQYLMEPIKAMQDFKLFLHRALD
ncbi:DUF2461 domain-containing protein [Olivibacter sp. SDN3]|uniref:DUF2461 domain-containing protein n=1 Tax=Olivibacter sp. SDN3 TaxID=2764720 RepID=UPI0016512086|nr:DUF2461 domain-containing protein [Olivibacter sp. SDN3]QNL51158.1 DUF2461 domain-containing protein [Olivibacter sp. SDN3]